MKATSLRKILISVLCALTVFTGAAAYKGFSNVNEAKASTVAVSSDIQAVLDAMNSAFANRYATAEYVQNYSMANGGTASGIMLKIHFASILFFVFFYLSQHKIVYIIANKKTDGLITSV